MLSKKHIPAVIISILIVILVVNLSTRSQEKYAIQAEDNIHTITDLHIKVIPAPNNTYGYKIQRNGQTIIHQQNIPAVPGVEGFRTEDQAMKVGLFVVEKLKKGKFPPGVSVEELDSLGVLQQP